MFNYSKHVGAGAPVYLAAVLKYFIGEVLELSGTAAYDITEKFPLKLAILNYVELRKLLGGMNFAQGGEFPKIQSFCQRRPQRKLK